MRIHSAPACWQHDYFHERNSIILFVCVTFKIIGKWRGANNIFRAETDWQREEEIENQLIPEIKKAPIATLIATTGNYDDRVISDH